MKYPRYCNQQATSIFDTVHTEHPDLLTSYQLLINFGAYSIYSLKPWNNEIRENYRETIHEKIDLNPALLLRFFTSSHGDWCPF